jgi:GntR family transcriptional regulator
LTTNPSIVSMNQEVRPLTFGGIVKQIKNGKNPLHLQVQHHLVHLIRAGTFPPGSKLPSEADLSDHIGVSRPTLREALKSLQQEGVILRKHGVGTFVSAHNSVMESGLEVLESLDRIAKSRGLTIEVAHLKVVERPASAKEQGLLSFPVEKSSSVIDVERIIKIDGAPVAYLKDVVPLIYLRKKDLENGFTGSVLDLFLGNGKPLPTISRAEIEAVNADAGLAALMEIEKGMALLKLTGQLLSDDENVLDYSLTYFIPGKFTFNIMRRVAI